MNLTNIQLGSNTAPGSPFTVNRYIDANSFKLVINGTGTNIFELTTGVSGATRRFAFASSGQYTMDAYGSGTFTGTETKWLAVTAAGLVIEKDPPSGSTITADNGLTMSTATNVQLFGTVGTPATLLHDSYLDATSSYRLDITGAIDNPNYIFSVTNTSSFGNTIHAIADIGTAINGAATGGTGVNGNSVNGVGGVFSSTNTNGLQVQSTTSSAAIFTVLPTSTNTVVPVIGLYRISSGGAGGDGIGGSLEFYNYSDNSNQRLSNQIISKLTTAADATRTSQLIITGVNSAVTADLLTIYGSGQHQFNKYGSGTFTGTDVYWLAVTSAGLIIEKTPPAGSDTNFAITDLTSTGDRVHTFGADTCQITFNSLAGDSGLKLTSTSTAAASNVQKVLEVSLSGANANAGQTTYGIYASNVHTGSVPTNIGVYGTANGGTANKGIYGVGGNSAGSFGVHGESSSTSGIGVLGQANGSTAFGVKGTTDNTGGAALSGEVALSSLTTGRALVLTAYNGSGAGGTALGASLTWSLESTTAQRDAGGITVSWADGTDASRATSMSIDGIFGASGVNLLTLAGDGSVKLRPITATAASAITAVQGMIVMVSSTNATFTAVGFWGYDGTNWTQF